MSQEAATKREFFTVVVFDVFQNEHIFEVESMSKAREYAKRIITEGLWFIEPVTSHEVFYPVHQVVKVIIK